MDEYKISYPVNMDRSFNDGVYDVGELKDFDKTLNGSACSWCEYLPASYDGSRPCPLVIVFHGGGGAGPSTAHRTGWQLSAEKQGYLLMFQSSTAPTHMWEMPQECDDTWSIVEDMCARLNIDRSRIYCSGMSYGDVMSLAFSCRYADRLAGAGYFCGPTMKHNLLQPPVCALPVIQLRGEVDLVLGPEQHQFPELADLTVAKALAHKERNYDYNRKLWLEVNGNDAFPALTVRGRDTWAVYRKSCADVIYIERKGMTHREPADGAELFWNCCFARFARVNGQIVEIAGDEALPKPDGNTIFAAAGYEAALLGGEKVSLGGKAALGCMRGPSFGLTAPWDCDRTEAVYVPAKFLERAFGVALSFTDKGVEFLRGGVRYRFFYNKPLVIIDGVFVEMAKSFLSIEEGMFMPLVEVAKLFGLFGSEMYGVACVEGAPNEIASGAARIAKEVL